MTSKIKFTSSALIALAAIGFTANADLITVTGITGHDGGNWPASLGHLTDMLNGDGSNTFGSGDHNPGMDTLADPTDPSTWLYSGGSWHQEWKADSRLDAGISSNGKIGWTVLDLGSSTANLENMYLWNVRHQSNTENVDTFNVYYADTPAVTLPGMPNSKTTTGDYDFAGGGWTLLNGGGPMTLAQNTTNNNTYQMDLALGGISAQYIGIEILTAGNGAGAGRVGLAQVELTSAIPEPHSAILLGMGLAVLAGARRRVFRG